MSRLSDDNRDGYAVIKSTLTWAVIIIVVLTIAALGIYLWVSGSLHGSNPASSGPVGTQVIVLVKANDVQGDLSPAP